MSQRPGRKVMALRRIRRQCEQRLQRLELPTPFDLEVLRTTIEGQRGHPLVFLPLRWISEVTGIWIALSSVDIIVHSRAMSRVHQEHIIVHEMSHMFCGHQPAYSAADIAALSFLDGETEFLDVARWTRQYGLYRRVHTSEEEQEVELLASLIVARMSGSKTVTPVSTYLEAVLEDGARRPA